MDFYGVSASPPCRAVLMTAKILGVELNQKNLDMLNGEHLKPEFLKINPQHTIPTIVDNGFSVWESRAILIYLADKYGKDDSLYPKCNKKRAIVNQRLFFDLGVLYQSFGEYYQPIRQKQQPDPEKLKKLQTAFEHINNFLEGHSYVAGDNLTIADISLVATVSTITVLGFDYSKFTNVTKWYQQCQKVIPNWKENWDGCLALKEYFENGPPHK